MQGIFPTDSFQDPYPFYAQLRREAPVQRIDPPGAWMISRYADVAFVLKTPQVFSSKIMAGADPYLLGNDPPDHTRVRRAVTAAFSPTRIAALEDCIREMTDRLVTDLIDARECDLRASLTVPLPLSVVAELLGVRDGPSLENLSRWSNAFVRAGSGAANPAQTGELMRDLKAFEAFAVELIAERRRAPADDVVTDLLRCSDPELTDPEAVSLSRLLVIAGSETTTNLLGNALVAILERPELHDALAGDPSIFPGLIDETLRFDPPVQFLQRRTLQAIELAGVSIPAGELVIALLGSANRDEQRFDEPDRFDPTRKSGGNLAFGTGPHACLGAALARMEARVVLESLGPHIHGLRLLDQPVPRVETPPLRGPQRLRVQVQV